MGLSRGPKHIKGCSPLPIWKKRHGEVVAEIKARLKKEEQQLQNKASKEAAEKSVNGIDIRCALNMCPKPEEVNEAWAKVLAAKGLPIDFVDDPFVRAAITMAARAGPVYIDAKDCKLPHEDTILNHSMGIVIEALVANPACIQAVALQPTAARTKQPSRRASGCT